MMVFWFVFGGCNKQAVVVRMRLKHPPQGHTDLYILHRLQGPLLGVHL